MIHLVKDSHVHFNGQKPKEKIYVVLRRHIFFLVIGYMFTLIKSIMALYLYFFLPLTFPLLAEGLIGQFYDLALLLVALFILYTMFVTWVHYYLDSYIVTSERILSIDQIDFFHRRIAEADIGNVQDIKVRVEGFFATLLKFGDVRIQTAGADSGTLWLREIPQPYETKDLILKLSEKNRNLDLHHAYTYRPTPATPEPSSQATSDSQPNDEDSSTI